MTAAFLDLDEPVPAEWQRGVVALGNFDGVHRGHHRLLARLRDRARALGGPAVAVCLDPHPIRWLRPEIKLQTLTSIERRLALLRDSGADFAVALRTKPALLSLSPHEFFRRTLAEGFRIRGMVEGADFRFGKDRGGDTTTLAELCRSIGAEFSAVPLELDDGAALSSTRIRQALTTGDVEEAAALAGRRPAVFGTVAAGAGRGRTLGIPTANLAEIREMLPADGVYAVRALDADGPTWGAANIGPNPTFGEDARKVEVHFLDWSGNLYGKRLGVEFVRHLRGVKTFAGPGELLEHIQRDVAEVRETAETTPPEPPRANLARTIDQWVRMDSVESLEPLGVAFAGAVFRSPEEVELRWRLPENRTATLPPSQRFDLLFHLEERLRRAFPEVRYAANASVA